MAFVILLAAVLVCGAGAEKSNPLGEVVSLLGDLSNKITKDGEAEEKAFKEYFEYCDDVSKHTDNVITTLTSQKDKLTATVEELSGNIQAAETKISGLAADIATGTKDVESATAIRKQESEDFAASEAELVSAIDTLGRALLILQREMQKNPAALAQVDSSDLRGVIQTLGAVIDAASFSATDKDHLLALVQAQQEAAEDDGDVGAPAGATYKTHSTGILDVLSDLQEKAEAKLAELRKAEKTARHNFDMLKQSLSDQLTQDGSDMDKTKYNKAAAEESRAASEGDLAATVSDLKQSNQELSTAQSTCMRVATDHEETVRARNEELKTLAHATKTLKETMSGAVSQTYSFIQVGLRTGADLARSEVITLVKKLARQHHSAALAQLASRIAAVMRYGEASGDDPFVKVKSLISAMIARLESEASAAATEKGYCDDEMSKTELKKGELEEDVAKLTNKIDVAAAKSAELKEEVHEIQAQLAKEASEQAENEKWHQETHAAYAQAKADLELGLSGVRKALDMLRDYYATSASALVQQPSAPELHESSTGAGQSIIGILEVVESDFATNLAKEEMEESSNQDTYSKLTQQYMILKTQKDQDVKYKTEEFTRLDKAISEHSSDRDGLNMQLSAVNEYYSKLKDRCIARPETYESRKARREAEINGLKEALSILENETALMQSTGKKHGRHMRGALKADN